MKNTRLLDITIGVGSHGLPCCPHTITGIRVTGSPDTYNNTNFKKTSRAMIDIAVHNCPHCGINMCVVGSDNTYVNNFKVHRLGDMETEFCGSGITVTGSDDTYVNG